MPNPIFTSCLKGSTKTGVSWTFDWLFEEILGSFFVGSLWFVIFYFVFLTVLIFDLVFLVESFSGCFSWILVSSSFSIFWILQSSCCLLNWCLMTSNWGCTLETSPEISSSNSSYLSLDTRNFQGRGRGTLAQIARKPCSSGSISPGNLCNKCSSNCSYSFCGT